MRIRLVIALFVSLLLFQAPIAQAADDQAVLIYLPLSDRRFGTKDELERLFKLEESIAQAVASAKVGEHDGNEVGNGEFTIYCYGPSATKLFNAVKPVLSESAYSRKIVVVVRHGGPGASEEKHRL